MICMNTLAIPAARLSEHIETLRTAQQAWEAVPVRGRLLPVQTLRHLLATECASLCAATARDLGKSTEETIAGDLLPLAAACKFLEREAALRFSFTADGLTLEAIGSEQAQASETIDAVLTGGDMVVSLKPQFLLDALSAVHSEFIRIAFTKTDNPKKPGPVLITGQSSRDQDGGGSYRYLLQPNLLMQ